MTAPIFRSLDQLTGDLAPSPVGRILDSADEISGELDRLRAENASLKAELEQRHATIEFLSSSRENAMTEGDDLALAVYRLRRDNVKLAEVSDGLARAVDQLADERDEAVIRAQELWVQVCDQAAELNQLRAQLDRARAVEGYHGITSGGLK